VNRTHPVTNALYSIAAVDPATGHVVELEIAAETPHDAKSRAEHSGLLFVIVRSIPEKHPRNGDGVAPPPE
jgi:hypothetical protein